MIKSIYKTEKSKEIILKAYREILNESPVELKENIVATSQGKTYIYTCGNPDHSPLFLIHGSGSNSFCWLGDLINYSKDHFVYLIDIIGEANFSEENRPTYKGDYYAVWLNDIMNYFDLSHVDIVGLSLGGWMATHFAIHYPNKVNKMVLISTGGFAKTKLTFYLKLFSYLILRASSEEKIIKLLNGGILPEKNPGLIKAMKFTNLINQHMHLRNEPLPIFSRQELQVISCPILSIYGEKDALLHPMKSVNYLKENVSHVKTMILKDVGHVVTDITQDTLLFLKGENNENTPL